MQDKDVKSELDPWAKFGNMGNSYEPGAVSEESIKRADEWQSAMEDVIKDEKHKDIATLFGALSEMEPEEEDERILDCKNGGR